MILLMSPALIDLSVFSACSTSVVRRLTSASGASSAARADACEADGRADQQRTGQQQAAKAAALK